MLSRLLQSRFRSSESPLSFPKCLYRVGQKSDTPLVLSFVSCHMHCICNFCLLIYNFHQSLTAYVRKLCFMRINCNFVTMVGLTNGERCLIDYLHVEKHRDSERIRKVFLNKRTHSN